MAKLKLDLHPIYRDSDKIEAALANILREAEEKRIGEVEIIPGKGSGALKKTVLRFLERPEVRSRYHRIVKDSDNWGRLFVYFRWSPSEPAAKQSSGQALPGYTCFCCGALNPVPEGWPDTAACITECPSCGSPNRLHARRLRADEALQGECGYD